MNFSDGIFNLYVEWAVIWWWVHLSGNFILLLIVKTFDFLFKFECSKSLTIMCLQFCFDSDRWFHAKNRRKAKTGQGAQRRAGKATWYFHIPLKITLSKIFLLKELLSLLIHVLSLFVSLLGTRDKVCSWSCISVHLWTWMKKILIWSENTVESFSLLKLYVTYDLPFLRDHPANLTNSLLKALTKTLWEIKL